MAFRCPYCRFSVSVKTPPKPGTYTPKCPKCAAKISLVVPKESDSEWAATKIPGEKPNLPEQDEDTVTIAVPEEFRPKPTSTKPPSQPNTSKSSGNLASGDTELMPSVDGELLRRAAKSDNDDDTTAELALPPSKLTDDETGVFELPPDDSRAQHETRKESNPQVSRKPPKPQSSQPPVSESEIPSQIGGYEVAKELGRGGMGAVYLARQISLDRMVALKVMNSRWASDPVFLARFTREAFAAAQLVHHNVVQIYDIGEHQGLNFFSMEFVEGNSLGDIVKKNGTLPRDEAISHVIQAARGLKYAHEQGMIHRDVKPDNLMLNVHGVVKVADLGLVKTAAMSVADDALPKTDGDVDSGKKSKTGLSSLPPDITQANTAMGSPAYMSPEQCRDSTKVDPRADIYSLGCTLYALLAGRPPFHGKTAFEVMAKHATEPVVSIPEISADLDSVIRKSLAKSVDERYQSMDEFIYELEKCLPGRGAQFLPSEEHISALETNIKRFRDVPAAKIRRKLVPVFFLGGIAAIISTGLFGWLSVSVTLLALMLETVLVYFVVDGFMRKTLVFRKARQWIFGAGVGDWSIAIFSGLFGLLVLWLLGIHWLFLGVTIFAVGLACAMHFVADRGLESQRAGIIEDTERMLKRFRIRGMEEDSLRLFVAQNAGVYWEEFFEVLFGFEAKLAMRPRVLEITDGTRLPRFAAWREPLLAGIERAILARKEKRARKLLAKIEARKFQAEGLSEKEAKRKASVEADELVAHAGTANKTIVMPNRDKTSKYEKAKVARLKQTQDATDSQGKSITNLLGVIFGVRFRIVLAMLMITAGALWAKQFKSNELSGIRKTGEVLVQSESSKTNELAAKKAMGLVETMLDRQPGMKVAGIDVSRFVDSLNPLIAGLILLTSVFYGHRTSVLLCVAGAFVAAVPHLVIGLSPEALESLEKARTEGGFTLQIHQITMSAGLILAGIAFVIGFRRR